MEPIFNYLSWRGDLTLEKEKFSIIDAFILSLFFYLPFDGVLPKYPSEKIVTIQDAVENFFKKYPNKPFDAGVLLGKYPSLLAEYLAKSKRFQNISMTLFVNKIDFNHQEQFSAITFFLPKNTLYIVFKGTDDSWIGWQENLNMLIDFPLPSQKNARRYIQKIHTLYPSYRLFVGGHSKGGNLAFYASSTSEKEIQRKIKKVYTFDGPGISQKLFKPTSLSFIEKKVIQVVPKDCIVGNLFDNLITNRIIIQTTKNGLQSHWGFFWIIEGNHFLETSSCSELSQSIQKEVNDFLKRLKKEEKMQLKEEIYQMLLSTKKTTLSELKSAAITTLLLLRKLSSKNRKIIFSFLRIFFKNGII